MKILKRVLLITTAFAMVCLTLVSCGKSSDGEKQPEFVYSAKSAEISGGVKGEFESFAYSGGRVYFISEHTPDPESTYSEFYLNSADADGNNFSSALIEAGENIYVCPPAFAPDGTGYYIRALKRKDESREYLLKTFAGETSSSDITGIIEERAPDMYPSYLFVSEENIYIGSYSGIVILDRAGNFVSAVNDAESVRNLCSGKDGKAYATTWSGSGYELHGIDETAGKLEDSLDFPFEGYDNKVVSGGGGYDLFVSDGTALFGFSFDSGKTELLNWTRAGVSLMEVTDIFYGGEDRFICAGKSHPYGYPKISVLTKQPAPSGKKTEIVLAGKEYNIDGFIENRAVKFNAASDKYFINVKKYPADDDRLNLDIISGKAPDIFIYGSYTPADSYIAKGIFADMYEFIDRDSELDRSDFVPNLLAACETDGKLCRFTDKFKVYTVLGKTSIFGDKAGITVDRLTEIAAARPAGTEILPASTKGDVLDFAMDISGSEFIDFKSRTCRFDSEDFVKLLEYANTYISEQEGDEYFDDAFWSRFESMYADESALLMLTNLSDYADVYRFERANFGEEVTAVGFPCESGTGTSFIVDSGFAISGKSKNKEGAWEFVRTLLLPEYQDSCDCFPVRKDSLEKAAKAAMKYDPDRVNNAVVLMGQMMLSMGTSGIGEPKQADIDKMNEIIASARGLMTYDPSVRDIIAEEAATYFNGTKTSREAAELIQTRVKLYLDERF